MVWVPIVAWRPANVRRNQKIHKTQGCGHGLTSSEKPKHAPPFLTRRVPGPYTTTDVLA